MRAAIVILIFHSPFSTGHKGVSHLSSWRSYPIGSSFSSFFILHSPILHSLRRCDNPNAIRVTCIILPSQIHIILSVVCYSLHINIKYVTFGHKLPYEIKITFGEISHKLCQTNSNVARNNVSVVADELPSRITIYTCLTIDIWTWRRRHTSPWFYAHWCHPPKLGGLPAKLAPEVFNFTMDTPSLPESA
jgi:hypothetical protein